MSESQKQDYQRLRNLGFPAMGAKILATDDAYGLSSYARLMEKGLVCVNQDKTATIMEYEKASRRNLMSKRKI